MLAMLANCVNPFCSRPFRYLEQGKLFVTEYPPTVASRFNLRPTREHFWLCEECARMMTIAVRREHGGVTVRIINLPPNGRRKLDFVPGKTGDSTQQAAFSERARPEFSFESQ
ncbi:MAG: hypothetical protein C5B46_02975 [Proteobacteria bacterium]|nr:MAG: hypothetical protein C5B46_02975 [Pseudomonadota bacterium]